MSAQVVFYNVLKCFTFLMLFCIISYFTSDSFVVYILYVASAVYIYYFLYSTKFINWSIDYLTTSNNNLKFSKKSNINEQNNLNRIKTNIIINAIKSAKSNSLPNSKLLTNNVYKFKYYRNNSSSVILNKNTLTNKTDKNVNLKTPNRGLTDLTGYKDKDDTQLSPQSERFVQNPLCPSSKFNTKLDLHTYMNINSPGFISRIVQRATESSMIQNKYSPNEVKPVVKFSSSPPLSKFSEYYSSYRILPYNDFSQDMTADTNIIEKRDLVRNIRDISRKRNYIQEEEDSNDVTKRTRINGRHLPINKNSGILINDNGQSYEIPINSAQNKRARDDCDIDETINKKKCDVDRREIARMLSYSSSIGVYAPHIVQRNSAVKRKAEKHSKSPDNIEKLRKVQSPSKDNSPTTNGTHQVDEKKSCRCECNVDLLEPPLHNATDDTNNALEAIEENDKNNSEIVSTADNEKLEQNWNLTKSSSSVDGKSDSSHPDKTCRGRILNRTNNKIIYSKITEEEDHSPFTIPEWEFDNEPPPGLHSGGVKDAEDDYNEVVLNKLINGQIEDAIAMLSRENEDETTEIKKTLKSKEFESPKTKKHVTFNLPSESGSTERNNVLPVVTVPSSFVATTTTNLNQFINGEPNSSSISLDTTMPSTLFSPSSNALNSVQTTFPPVNKVSPMSSQLFNIASNDNYSIVEKTDKNSTVPNFNEINTSLPANSVAVNVSSISNSATEGGFSFPDYGKPSPTSVVSSTPLSLSSFVNNSVSFPSSVSTVTNIVPAPSINQNTDKSATPSFGADTGGFHFSVSKTAINNSDISVTNTNNFSGFTGNITGSINNNDNVNKSTSNVFDMAASSPAVTTNSDFNSAMQSTFTTPAFQFSANAQTKPVAAVVGNPVAPINGFSNNTPGLLNNGGFQFTAPNPSPFSATGTSLTNVAPIGGGFSMGTGSSTMKSRPKGGRKR